MSKESEIWDEINQMKSDLAALKEKKKIIEEVGQTLQEVHEKGREALDQVENAIETLRKVYSEEDD